MKAILNDEAKDILTRLGIEIVEFDLERELRKSVMTATDLPKCMGFGYGDDSVRTVVASKLELEPEFDGNYATRRGSYLEGMLLSEAIRINHMALVELCETRRIVITLGEFFLHEDEPIGASLDAAIKDADTAEVLDVWEFKTTRARWVGLPDRVIWQCLGQLACCSSVDKVKVYYDDANGFGTAEVVWSDDHFDTIIEWARIVKKYVDEKKIPPVAEMVKAEVAKKIKGKLPTVQATSDMSILRYKIAEARTKRLGAERLAKAFKEEEDQFIAELAKMVPEFGLKVLFDDAEFSKRQQYYGGGLSAQGKDAVATILLQEIQKKMDPKEYEELSERLDKVREAHTAQRVLKDINVFKTKAESMAEENGEGQDEAQPGESV